MLVDFSAPVCALLVLLDDAADHCQDAYAYVTAHACALPPARASGGREEGWGAAVSRSQFKLAPRDPAIHLPSPTVRSQRYIYNSMCKF